MTKKLTLDAIIARYSDVEHNSENYEIGGGMSAERYASRRHEDARNDEGKLTMGEATALLKRATGRPTAFVKKLLNIAVPNAEWHHAGSYRGKMGVTYFITATMLVTIAREWDSLATRLDAIESRAARQQTFCEQNGTRVVRALKKPEFFVEEFSEMKGKFGWFRTDHNYKLPEYYTGWSFKTAEDWLAHRAI